MQEMDIDPLVLVLLFLSFSLSVLMRGHFSVVRYSEWGHFSLNNHTNEAESS
jgi:hypothetical protein